MARGQSSLRVVWGDAVKQQLRFIFVLPYVPHQETNALDDEPLECVLTRSGQDPVVVNLDIEGVAEPEHGRWIDPAHP